MEEKERKKEVRTSYPVKTGVKAGLFDRLILEAKARRKAKKSAVA